MTEAELNLLLVEDEPLLQFVFKRQMQKLGFSVHSVGNGAAAVEQVAQGKFDMVFMDVNMPVMDGLHATAQIRKQEKFSGKRIPIIGLTAYAERQMCISAGMDDYLQKPVMLDELKLTIEKWGSGDVSGEVSAQEGIDKILKLRRRQDLDPEI